MATAPPDPPVDPALADDPAELLRHLVRFDTTNPPGDERACVEWLEALLDAGGLETETYAKDPDRPNLVARLSGDGDAAPLMLYGHVDVVPADPDAWTHPPFEAVREDGLIWGRGALDMKGGVAMMVAAALRAARDDVPLAGDLLVMILSDEEAGGEYGAGFMVEEHPEIFADVEFALGEFGGFPTEIAGERFYPIQVAEKTVCWSELTFHGEAGHASRPRPGGAMAKMARAVTAIDESRLPVHVTPPVEEMIEAIADGLGLLAGLQLRRVLDPEQTDDALDSMDDGAERLDALFHNTASPTIVDASESPNVVPDEVTLTLDCRLLPGQTDEDVRRELRAVVPEDVEFDFEPILYEPGPAETDHALFDLLADVLESADPDGTAIPYVLLAGTDGRHLARAGVQSYGFTPMCVPEGFEVLDSVHSPDERIPVEALPFGTKRIREVIERYEGRPT